MSQAARQTHLEFYREHQITPVRYDLSNLDAHLERRFALYAKLGLSPLTFKHSKVLEIAAGTGHNSLYLAQLMPAQLVLVEPNATGVEHIREAYSNFAKPHTCPELISQTVEEYLPQGTFDIVLCENWLGVSKHELAMLDKISGMVSQQGILVITTVSPLGFVPNLLRRFLAIYLAPHNKDFLERTELLVAAFGSHLDTLSSMTRNKEDWVQDNMLNPAYFGLCLSIPQVLERLGGSFEALGSSPVFAEDWRWFKGLHGVERNTNAHFLTEYMRKAHNFLDYREQPQVGNSLLNAQLEDKAKQLLTAITAHEDAYLNGSATLPAVQEISHLLDDLITLLPSHLVQAIRGLSEVQNLIKNPVFINSASVANMTDFRGLFGRETAYVSLMRV